MLEGSLQAEYNKYFNSGVKDTLINTKIKDEPKVKKNKTEAN